ncbi:MAG: hypothetical protein SFV51_16230 [Bryobacteraceae bacterium]|nr:hypothetical protein [Bryobacteraceae bacterium]
MDTAPDGFLHPLNLQRGHIRYFPVVPGRVEFAIEVRRAILRDQPQVVAVQFPSFYQPLLDEAIARLPELSVILTAGDDEDDNVYYPIEPTDPFVEAIRTAQEIGAQVMLVEPDAMDPRLTHANRYPDSYAIRRTGLEKYVESCRLFPPERTTGSMMLGSGIAYRLQGTNPLAPTMAVVSLHVLEAVLDAMEEPQPEPEPPPGSFELRLVNPHPDCLAEITAETPFLQERYNRYREDPLPHRGEPLLDRPKVQYDLLKEAEESYRAITGDVIAHWQRRAIAKFSRNLAATGGDLIAGLYDLTVAARSVVDDNYAWEVWQTANRYPPQRDVCEIETVTLSASEVFLDTRKLRIRRRLPRPKQLSRPWNLKPRKKEKRPGEWAESLDGDSICSYPPEDLLVEGYAEFLKQKAKSILSSEPTRVEPFTSSLLDGIDLRETVRNWHQRKIYVKQTQRLAGDVGAVVIIFDEDRDNRYTFMTTWLGENQNESDMSFYSTEPFHQLVGPGIGRAEYGGLLMALPPRRMYDVWNDRDYDFAESKPERLLLAALDYTIQPYVVYVAAKPPRSIFRSIAAHLGRKILYIPLGQLSPAKLKKVRVVHVLDGHHRRNLAKEYIW